MLKRALLAGAFAAFAAVSVNAMNISDIDLSKAPTCGIKCIAQNVALSPCKTITNTECVCTDHALSVAIEACFAKECTPREALKIAKISKDLCNVPPRNKTLAVWLVPLVVIILSTVFYFLRIASRIVMSQSIDAGDITLGASVALTFPFLWAAFALADNGLGQDVWNIPADNITSILNKYWWAELFYQAALSLTRVSILLFYLKVFPQDDVRIPSLVLMGLNLGYLVAFEIATIFQCYPVYGAWTFWDGTFQGHCNNIHVQSWLSAAFNILLDLLIIILPLPALAKLSVSRKKKIQIMVMFSVGFFITIISIIRLKTLVVFASSTNVSYDYVEPGLYSIVEASVGIICGCLPMVRALLITLMPKVFPLTELRSKLSSSGLKSDMGTGQKFDRLEDPAEQHGQLQQPVKGHIRVETEWSVRNNDGGFLDSASQSEVELVPVKVRRSETNVESGLGTKTSKQTRPLNWSRPLPPSGPDGGQR
ncbi:hypothetical protein F5Y17DRAFT_401884 [Xylariaceae sp. FL0594]|nr:hypothetical protein F5Y17DRAFT_401884 [Xylariaceae sp. FL0594]